MTTCGSCSISGTFSSYFVIAGKFDNKLQLMKLSANNCIHDEDVTVELPSPAYTTADWYFKDAYSEGTNYAAIARNDATPNTMILYYIDTNDYSGSLRAREVTFSSSVDYVKV